MKTPLRSLRLPLNRIPTCFRLCIALWLASGCSAHRPVSDLSPEQAENLMRRPFGFSDIILIDVRTTAEFDSGHIPGAIHLDYQAPDFSEKVAALDRTAVYLVYCRGGVRSARAMQIMQRMGFSRVYNLQGGLNRWQADGRPIVKPVVDSSSDEKQP